MCGIAFCLSAEWSALPTEWAGLVAANASRGLDSQLTHTSTTPLHRLTFFSSVLHLRGPTVFAQPVVCPETGDVFCWNGQILDGLSNERLDSDKGSDTQAVWDKLRGTGGREDRVREVFAEVEGPWAMIYYHAASQTLFISRDPLGRRSLMLSRPTPIRPRLVLASVSSAQTQGWDWEELACEGFVRIDLGSFLLDGSCDLEMIPRESTSASSSSLLSILPVNATLPGPSFSEPLPHPTIFPDDDETLVRAADGMIDALSESVRRRVANIPAQSDPRQARLAVLFSGGIDCTVLALLAHRYIPLDEPIDLLNVGFENPRSLENLLQLKRRQAASDAKGKGKARGPPLDGDVESLSCAGEETEETEEEKRQRVYGVPDRLTGLEAVEELRRLSPGRTWNFVEVDVPYEECTRLTPHVLSLMFPSHTIMDLSLALALYFASRGQGSLPDPSSPPGTSRIAYTSKAKVLLSGLGADEQFGGYARHRRAYEMGGWQGVIEEIQLDLSRLPTRNLGRDDRIVSSHAKEVRYPYLSLSFLNHVSLLPICHKMEFRYTEPRGEGDKAVGDKLCLRLGAGRMGFEEDGAKGRKKRAMQFGSRSAKMEVEEGKKGGGKAGRKGMGGSRVGSGGGGGE